MAKTVWTDTQIIGQLDSGYHWSGANLTYGFPTDASWFPYGESTGFSALNSAQQATATLVIHMWDDLILPDFSLAANGATANIKYENTTTNIGYAQAYYPGGWAGAGSVWFNPAYGSNSGTNNLVTPTIGQWGFAAYVHETGHALGLDHPGAYNGGSPTYATDALYMQDSQQYTIMSYFTASNTGADWVASDGRTYYAQTPMMHDIMTLQAIYGAETTTRTGNTTYGFNSNAGLSVFDFSVNNHPIVCIYDAGGADTLDLSGWNYSCVIDLTPGSFSNADMMTCNISIANNTWIENAVGGGGNDVLVGNNIANHLDGRAGNDTLTGGGASDVFIYSVGYGADIITDFIAGSTATHDIIDLTGFGSSIASFSNILALATQVGTSTILTFGTGSTLTLQNVNLAGLTSDDFLFVAGPAGPNQAPTDIQLSNASVYENTAGSSVGNILVADPDGNSAFTFAVSDARFQVSGSPGAYQLKLASGTSLDFETEPAINLTVVATDAGGLSTQKDFTISVLDVGGAIIIGTAGANIIDSTHTVSSQSFVSAENDVVYGLAGNDVIHGLGGDDYLSGNIGNDILYGDAGNDILIGGAGADALYGGDGNDQFIVTGTEAQADTISGGNGSDTIVVGGTVALTLNNFNATASSIEVWQGNGMALLGTTAANVFDLSGLTSIAGLSYVDGGSGNDTIIGSSFADDLRGGAGIDTFIGGAGDDILTGGAGADSLDGGEGNDQFIATGTEAQADTIFGGNGTDTIVIGGTVSLTLNNFNATASSIEVWQGNGMALLGTTAANVFDLSGLTSITGLIYVDGGSGDDTIIGSSFADDLRGGAGNDTLTGGNGDDILTGGAGADSLDGGDGNDQFLVTGTEAQADTFSGGNGTDMIVVGGTVSLTLNNFNATASSLEVWQGNGLALLGTTAANVFDLSGLTSIAGLSYVDGGSGDDTIIGSSFADVLRGGAGNDTLTGGGGNDILTGGAGADILDGSDGNDQFLVMGTEAQADTISGGHGIDTIVVGGTASLTLNNFNAMASSIEVWQGNGMALLGTTVANIFDLSGLTSITGLSYVDSGSGDDTITGSSFADSLRGGTGNDTLTGGGGNDMLTGGSGNDTFVFGSGFGQDTITDFAAGAGIADVIKFDHSIFADFASVLAAASQAGSNLIITAGVNDTITLTNMTLAKLNADDFLFV